MKYKLSGTKKIPKKKAATFGFKTIETSDIKELVKFINTHAVIPCRVEGGHRLRKNAKEIYPWIRLDVDVKGEAKKIDKALKHIKYIKKPSTSNVKNPWKWHYYIPIKNVSQNYDAYKLQYYAFLAEFGIDLKDKSLASVVQNTNPMGDAGVQLTHVNGGKGKKYWSAPNKTAPKRKKLKEKHPDMKKADLWKILKGYDDHVERDKNGDRKHGAQGLGYEEFLKVGMALYDWCPVKGLKLYKKWAETTGSYYAETVQDKWDDFTRNLAGDVTIGSLIHMVHGEKKEITFKKEKGNVQPGKPGKSKKPKKKKKSSLDELPGQMNEKLLKSWGNQTVLFPGVMVEGMHTFIYGAAGSMKTTTIAWIALDVLKRFKDKKVHFWSFDAAQNHEKAIYDYVDDPRFMLSVESTADDFEEYYDGIIENDTDLSGIIIIVDTFKFITSNVNDKNANKKAMHYIKDLQKLGASVVSLGHTNKDGIKQSGTAEIEQDSDGILRIDREINVKSGEVVLTITAAGRTRFQAEGISLNCTPKGEGYVYLKSAMETMAVMDEVVDLATIADKKAIEAEVEKKRDVHKATQKIKDADNIRILRSVIKELKKDKIKEPTRGTIVIEMVKYSVNHKAVDRMLRLYLDEEWKHVIIKRPKLKPLQLYKTLKTQIPH